MGVILKWLCQDIQMANIFSTDTEIISVKQLKN